MPGLRHSRTAARPWVVISWARVQCYLEPKPQVWNAPIPLAHCLKVSSWLQGLIRNGIPEQPQYFCIYFYSGFMCFGNEGSLYIVVTYPPGIEAEGSAHHNIPESIHHCWIALSVIVACGKAEVTFADW